MASEPPQLSFTRHGDTDWTDSRRSAGRSVIPLNVVGEDRARRYGVSSGIWPLHPGTRNQLQKGAGS
ncbi:histidine phosphatase family protein [Paludisphaera borealis]|uniref:histidine phosphatase family protein n=1 Tax=Paludisphaera borealis TaxID=1387353 RepID=UPI0035A348DC